MNLRSAFLFVMLGVVAGSLQAQSYSYTLIPSLGGTSSEGNGINDSGIVVGASYTTFNASYDAFVYSNGTMTDMGTLGDSPGYSSAFAINDAGMIVGQSRNSQGHVDAFSFATGTMTDLGAFIPFAINNSGAVAGELLAGGLNHACVYGNGTITDLGTLGGSLSAATGINSAGMIAGWSDVAQGGRMAFSYTNGTMTSLGTLGGPSSQATGINSSGAIVGFSYITPNSVIGQHGFVFSNGKMTDICTLGGLNSYANAINDSGVVVGTSERAVGDGVAFVYKDGAMTDLNTLVDLPGFSLISAMGINDGGQIVADGMIGGTQFGVLLTPIPEPSAYAAVLGATALGFVAYRRRQLAGR